MKKGLKTKIVSFVLAIALLISQCSVLLSGITPVLAEETTNNVFSESPEAEKKYEWVATSLISNGDFETADETGWTVSKGDNIEWTIKNDEWATNNKTYMLKVSNDTNAAEAFSLSQSVTIPAGTYKLSWKQDGAGMASGLSVSISTKESEVTSATLAATTAWDQWVSYESAVFTLDATAAVEVAFSGEVNAGYWGDLDDIIIWSYEEVNSDSEQGGAEEPDPVEADVYVEKVTGMCDDFITGADVSSYLSIINSGASFYDKEGNKLDEQGFFNLLAAGGTNYIRIRVWNNPYDADGNGYGGGNNDLETAKIIGQYATKAGMKVLIDFHYSDFWADPGKQQAPKAWASMSAAEKTAAVTKYTTESLQYLLDNGVDVGMVQVGNETTNSICGVSFSSATQDACAIFDAGCDAVHAVASAYNKEILAAIHFTNPERSGNYANFAKRLNTYDVSYDVFASSYYPYWHGTIDNLTSVLKNVADTYGKKVMVAETSWAWTLEDGDGHDNTVRVGSNDSGQPYDFSVQGQCNEIRAVAQAVANVGDAGIGLFYWENAWIPVEYAYDEEGNLVEAILNSNKEKWESKGSGWASSYAGEYDATDAGKWFGGSAVDNQSWFDFSGKAIDTVDIYNYIRTGTAVKPLVTSVTVEDITVSLSEVEKLTLPEKATVSYNVGTTKEVVVAWDENAFADAKKNGIGNYEIAGTAVVDDIRYNVFWRLTIEADNLLQNPGFESVLTSWKVTGFDTKDAANNSHTGKGCLHFYASEDGTEMTASQTVTLNSGIYSASVFLQGGGAGEKDIFAIEVKVGEQVYGTTSTVNGWQNWSNPTIENIEIAEDNTEVTVTLILSDATAGVWGSFDDAKLIRTGDYASEPNGQLQKGLYITNWFDWDENGQIVRIEGEGTEYEGNFSAKDIDMQINGGMLAFRYIDAEGSASCPKESELQYDRSKLSLNLFSTVNYKNTGIAIYDVQFLDGIGDYTVGYSDQTITIHADYPNYGFYTTDHISLEGLICEPYELKDGNQTIYALAKEDTEWESFGFNEEKPVAAQFFLYDGGIEEIANGSALFSYKALENGRGYAISLNGDASAWPDGKDDYWAFNLSIRGKVTNKENQDTFYQEWNNDIRRNQNSSVLKAGLYVSSWFDWEDGRIVRIEGEGTEREGNFSDKRTNGTVNGCTVAFRYVDSENAATCPALEELQFDRSRLQLTLNCTVAYKETNIAIYDVQFLAGLGEYTIGYNNSSVTLEAMYPDYGFYTTKDQSVEGLTGWAQTGSEPIVIYAIPKEDNEWNSFEIDKDNPITAYTWIDGKQYIFEAGSPFYQLESYESTTGTAYKITISSNANDWPQNCDWMELTLHGKTTNPQTNEVWENDNNFRIELNQNGQARKGLYISGWINWNGDGQISGIEGSDQENPGRFDATDMYAEFTGAMVAIRYVDDQGNVYSPELKELDYDTSELSIQYFGNGYYKGSRINVYEIQFLKGVGTYQVAYNGESVTLEATLPNVGFYTGTKRTQETCLSGYRLEGNSNTIYAVLNPGDKYVPGPCYFNAIKPIVVGFWGENGFVEFKQDIYTYRIISPQVCAVTIHEEYWPEDMDSIVIRANGYWTSDQGDVGTMESCIDVCRYSCAREIAFVEENWHGISTYGGWGADPVKYDAEGKEVGTSVSIAKIADDGYGRPVIEKNYGVKDLALLKANYWWNEELEEDEVFYSIAETDAYKFVQDGTSIDMYFYEDGEYAVCLKSELSSRMMEDGLVDVDGLELAWIYAWYTPSVAFADESGTFIENGDYLFNEKQNTIYLYNTDYEWECPDEADLAKAEFYVEIEGQEADPKDVISYEYIAATENTPAFGKITLKGTESFYMEATIPVTDAEGLHWKNTVGIFGTYQMAEGFAATFDLEWDEDGNPVSIYDEPELIRNASVEIGNYALAFVNITGWDEYGNPVYAPISIMENDSEDSLKEELTITYRYSDGKEVEERILSCDEGDIVIGYEDENAALVITNLGNNIYDFRFQMIGTYILSYNGQSVELNMDFPALGIYRTNEKTRESLITSYEYEYSRYDENEKLYIIPNDSELAYIVATENWLGYTGFITATDEQKQAVKVFDTLDLELLEEKTEGYTLDVTTGITEIVLNADQKDTAVDDTPYQMYAHGSFTIAALTPEYGQLLDLVEAENHFYKGQDYDESAPLEGFEGLFVSQVEYENNAIDWDSDEATLWVRGASIQAVIDKLCELAEQGKTKNTGYIRINVSYVQGNEEYKSNSLTEQNINAPSGIKGICINGREDEYHVALTLGEGESANTTYPAALVATKLEGAESAPRNIYLVWVRPVEGEESSKFPQYYVLEGTPQTGLSFKKDAEGNFEIVTAINEEEIVEVNGAKYGDIHDYYIPVCFPNLTISKNTQVNIEGFFTENAKVTFVAADNGQLMSFVNGEQFSAFDVGSTSELSGELEVWTENGYEGASYQVAVEVIPEAATKCYITYVYQDGREDQIAVLDRNTSLDTPERTGYSFNGWYNEAGKKVIKATGNQTVYARWIANTYQVILNSNEGSGAIAKLSATYDKAVTLKAANFKKTGYTLAGWSFTSNGDKAFANEEAVYNLATKKSDVVNLYAIWVPTEYRVIYHTSGGKLENEKDKVATFTILDETFKLGNATGQPGYKFGGWYKENTYKTPINEIIAGTHEDMHVYAKWEPATYTIRFDANGGTGSVSDQTMYYNLPVKLNANKFTRTDYVFAGWSTDKQFNEETSRFFANAQSVTNEDLDISAEDFTEEKPSVTLYAVWKQVFTIHYNPNGGTLPNVEDEYQKYTYKQSKYDELATPVRTGYTFGGWYLDENFKTKFAKITATTTGDKELYAKWTPNTYTVTFNANGGSGKAKKQTLTYDQLTALTEVSKLKFTKKGNKFVGWKDEVSDEVYVDGQRVKNLTSEKGKNIILKAQWEAVTYTVNFELMGGTFAKISETEKYGTSGLDTEAAKFTYEISSTAYLLPEPSRDGYDFEGWYKEATYKNKVTSLAKNTTGDMTLYAKWRGMDYTVIFNANAPEGSAAGKMKNQAMVQGVPKALTKNGYKIAGYTFVGWSTEQKKVVDRLNVDLEAEGILANQAILYSNDKIENKDGKNYLTLYAVWSKTYSVSYNTNGGMNPENAITSYKYGVVGKLPTPVRDGYDFAGWYKDAKFKTRLAAAGDGIPTTTLGDLNLYAKWTAKTYTISFDANVPSEEKASLSGSMGNKTYTYNSAKALPTVGFKRTGYAFVGWSTSPASDDGLVGFTNKQKISGMPDGSYPKGGTLTLYAVWRSEFTISYDVNDEDWPDGTVPVKSYRYNQSSYPKLPVPVRDGYTFAGWYKDARYKSKVSSLTKTMYEDLELHAKWTGKSYTVTFDANAPEGAKASGKMKSQKLTYGTGKALTKNAYKVNGYTFIGWSTEPNGDVELQNAEKFAGFDTYAGQVTLYAVWEKNVYTITYKGIDPADQKETLCEEYTVTDTVALAEPEKIGYTFMGWYTDAKCKKKASDLKAGTTGDKTFYAKWVANTK